MVSCLRTVILPSYFFLQHLPDSLDNGVGTDECECVMNHGWIPLSVCWSVL